MRRHFTHRLSIVLLFFVTSIAPAFALPLSLSDVFEEILSPNPSGPGNTAAPGETEGTGPAELGIVSPPGLPPGAVPSAEGGFMIAPEYIVGPEISGYQWTSQDTYEADWLAYMLASNARLLGVPEEESEFEFPMVPVHAPLELNFPLMAEQDEAVPEPASLFTVLAGGVLLALMRRRQANDH